MMAISGNATTAEGLPVDFVLIFSWPTSELVVVAVPDESGDWSHEVPLTGEYGLTYIAAGCQPITHGPYYVEGQFTPDWLFLNDEAGAWYDPSDLTTLYQDSVGSTPVTSDGDPVGLMLDKSGNGNNAIQSVATSRPIYRTDGVLHWLEFDGANDYLTTQPVHLGTDLVVSASVTKTAEAVGVILSGNSSLTTSQPVDNFVLRLPRSNSLPGAVFATVAGNFPIVYEEGASTGQRTTVLTGAKVYGVNYLYVNGGLIGQISSSVVAFETPAIYIGGHDAGHFGGRIYGLILRSGGLTYREQTEDYLATKAGVTL